MAVVTQVDVYVTRTDRNHVTVRVTTSDAREGWGDASLYGREPAVVAFLERHAAPLLIGRDPHLIEDTWHLLRKGGYWRGGAIETAGIAAIDVALWDLKAQDAGLPLYQLLGGASREHVTLYAHASGATPDEAAESVDRCLDEGFSAVRVQFGLPGRPATYGLEDDSPSGSSADTALPEIESWDSAAYLHEAPRVFALMRERYGTAIRLLHDVHHRLTPVEAAALAKSLEPYDLLWLEDPTPLENPASLRLLRRHSTVPIATGEIFTQANDYRLLFEEGLIDYVRSSVTHVGGITPLRKLLDIAEFYGVRSGIHGPSDISPIGMAAALHLDLAVHNFGIQEFMEHSAQTLSLFPHAYSRNGGFAHPGEVPGLGARLDVEAAASHPYQPLTLPVARIDDGTLIHW